MSFAFVFPGQASQSVGMLSALAAGEPSVRRTFDEASAALGYDLWQLVQEGPEDLLNTTERTQPAMLVGGVAVYRVWRERGGPAPDLVAGHSLGEFTALVCAEALELGAAAALVRVRGQAMQEAVPVGAGAIAAILGLEDEQVIEGCRRAAEGAVVEAVNFNAPGQVAIAGERAAVRRAIQLLQSMGAKRAIELPVSVPVHSSLMQAAARRFGAQLASVELRRPQLRYVSAVDGREHAEPGELRDLLVRQLSSAVRWRDTIAALAAAGVSHIFECGPGQVLTSLNRRIERGRGTHCAPLESPEALAAALAAVRGG